MKILFIWKLTDEVEFYFLFQNDKWSLLEFFILKRWRAKKKLSSSVFFFQIKDIFIDKTMTECIEFYCYLKISSELTNTFLYYLLDLSNFLTYLSSIFVIFFNEESQLILETFDCIECLLSVSPIFKVKFVNILFCCN